MSRSKFQSTLPVGEATSGTAQRQDKQFISIHASRGGSDQLISAAVPGRSRFQSTLPVGEATGTSLKTMLQRLDFNPRFPWGKRQNTFSTAWNGVKFQSTLPVGEATTRILCNVDLIGISIHASRGGSDFRTNAGDYWQGISIHASRGGSDQTLPSTAESLTISIHASRGGSDCRVSWHTGRISYFNPRFPWGKRPSDSSVTVAFHIFQSTLPVGEATPFDTRDSLFVKISIHASRGGSDLVIFIHRCKIRSISIHASRGGSDYHSHILFCMGCLFQSTLPVGEATHFNVNIVSLIVISIHASRGGSDRLSS